MDHLKGKVFVEYLSPLKRMRIKGKLLKPPPLATIITYFNGRIYLAVGNTVWFTELYLYDWVDSVKGFLPFENNVTVLTAVSDGLYVGTETAVWYLSGTGSEAA